MNTICLSTSQSQCLIGSYWINLLFLEFPCTGRSSVSLFSHLVSLEIAAFLLQCEIACTDDPASSFSPHCIQYKSISLHPYSSPPWTQADLSRNPGQTRHNQPEEDAINAPTVCLPAAVPQRTGHFGKWGTCRNQEWSGSAWLSFFYKELSTQEKPLKTFLPSKYHGRDVSDHLPRKCHALTLPHLEWNAGPMQRGFSTVLPPTPAQQSICSSLHRSQTLLRPRHSYSHQNLYSGIFPSTVSGYQPQLQMKNSSGKG